MKRVLLSIATISAIVTFANAGKDVEPAVEPPVPVPVPPKVTPQSAPPLGLYIGGGFTYAHTSCECEEILTEDGPKRGSSSGDSYGVHLKAGYDFSDFFGVEARYIYTPWGDDGKTLKHYGLYAKPTFGVTEDLDLYALLGYGKTECEYEDLDEKGFAWGVGAEYLFNKKKDGAKEGWGVYAEYMQPLRKTGSKDIKTHVANVGVAYHY